MAWRIFTRKSNAVPSRLQFVGGTSKSNGMLDRRHVRLFSDDHLTDGLPRATSQYFAEAAKTITYLRQCCIWLFLSLGEERRPVVVRGTVPKCSCYSAPTLTAPQLYMITTTAVQKLLSKRSPPKSQPAVSRWRAGYRPWTCIPWSTSWKDSWLFGQFIGQAMAAMAEFKPDFRRTLGRFLLLSCFAVVSWETKW